MHQGEVSSFLLPTTADAADVLSGANKNNILSTAEKSRGRQAETMSRKCVFAFPTFPIDVANNGPGNWAPLKQPRIQTPTTVFCEPMRSDTN